MTHQALNEQSFSRGDEVYATPQVGYFFADDAKGEPAILRWPFLAPGNLMFDI